MLREPSSRKTGVEQGMARLVLMGGVGGVVMV